MKEISKVVIQVEYECDGKKKVCYGEIDKSKLENFDKGDGNYILMENDEMTLFSKMVLSYGHLTKMDDDYKEKFKKINQFIKKEWDDRHRIDFF